ncbi:MAG: hypothetical protein EXS31_07310 [Pedosphaera sp.]|nr:hypothetical protein [Pedosphaera sp.]
MKLSTLTIGLGLVYSLPHIFALLKPAAFTGAAQKFPRCEKTGYVLTILGTLWFLANVQSETISDFTSYKNIMLLGFGAVGLLACLFVKDFLAIRGLAIVLLVAAKLILDTARWHESQWRLVLSVLAYGWIIAGIWLTISPWRLRDWLNWVTKSHARLRLFSTVRLAFGLLLLALGLFVF